MFEVSVLGGRLIVTIAAAWDEVGRVDVQGHDLRAHLEFLDWLEHEAAGMFGHLIASRDQARPCDLAAALQAAAHRWHPHFTRAFITAVDPHLPAGAVS